MTEGGAKEPRTPADFAAQMRAAAERMMAGWTAAAGTAAGSAGTATPPMPGLPAMPAMPATMSARQMETFLEDLAARRTQVQALITQLESFDEQLGTLEASVRPFVEWTRAWADVEKTMSQFWHAPPASSGQ